MLSSYNSLMHTGGALISQKLKETKDVMDTIGAFMFRGKVKWGEERIKNSQESDKTEAEQLVLKSNIEIKETMSNKEKRKSALCALQGKNSIPEFVLDELDKKFTN